MEPDVTSKEYLLDRLVECSDTIARLVVVHGIPDREALLIMDAALRALEANGRHE